MRGCPLIVQKNNKQTNKAYQVTLIDLAWVL